MFNKKFKILRAGSHYDSDGDHGQAANACGHTTNERISQKPQHDMHIIHIIELALSSLVLVCSRSLFAPSVNLFSL